MAVGLLNKGQCDWVICLEALEGLALAQRVPRWFSWKLIIQKTLKWNNLLLLNPVLPPGPDCTSPKCPGRVLTCSFDVWWLAVVLGLPSLWQKRGTALLLEEHSCS